MAKLYHFTGLRALVGADGLAAMQGCDGARDVSGFAAPGSIIVDGLRASKDDSYDGALRSPLRPCVWLIDNPGMPEGFCSFHDYRISVVIVGSDSRLVRWPDYLRKHARDGVLAGLVEVPEAMRIESERFLLYFGNIAPGRFRGVERVQQASAKAA